MSILRHELTRIRHAFVKLSNVDTSASPSTVPEIGGSAITAEIIDEEGRQETRTTPESADDEPEVQAAKGKKTVPIGHRAIRSKQTRWRRVQEA